VPSKQRRHRRGQQRRAPAHLLHLRRGQPPLQGLQLIRQGLVRHRQHRERLTDQELLLQLQQHPARGGHRRQLQLQLPGCSR
jgi:hypothetical protein